MHAELRWFVFYTLQRHSPQPGDRSRYAKIEMLELRFSTRDSAVGLMLFSTIVALIPAVFLGVGWHAFSHTTRSLLVAAFGAFLCIALRFLYRWFVPFDYCVMFTQTAVESWRSDKRSIVSSIPVAEILSVRLDYHNIPSCWYTPRSSAFGKDIAFGFQLSASQLEQVQQFISLHWNGVRVVVQR
jgi:hypothetical protein